MKPTTAISIAILGVVGALVFVAVRKGSAFFAAINPLSNENAIAQGFDDVVSLVTEQDTSLGSLLFDFVQRLKGVPPFDPNAPVIVTEDDLRFVGPPRPPQG